MGHSLLVIIGTSESVILQFAESMVTYVSRVHEDVPNLYIVGHQSNAKIEMLNHKSLIT